MKFNYRRSFINFQQTKIQNDKVFASRSILWSSTSAVLWILAHKERKRERKEKRYPISLTLHESR